MKGGKIVKSGKGGEVVRDVKDVKHGAGGKIVRNVAVMLVSLGILVLLVMYMSGSFHEKIEPGTVKAAREFVGDQPADVVHRIVDTEVVEVVGTVRAERRSDVASKIMAAIEKVDVRAGDRVEKGKVLVRLDDRDAKARLEEANQAVVAAEANLDNARKAFDRQKDLLEKKAGTKQDFDESEARHRVAEADLKRAREAVKGAETNLSLTVIEAPLSGIVVDKLVDVGDTAAPGKPLMTIYDPTAFRLEAAIPEAFSSDVSIGREMKVRLDALDKTVVGEVSEIVPQTETASRSFLVKVHVPEDPRLVEGMFGRLLVPARERVRFCVAQTAVREIGQLRFVSVVRKDGSLDRRQVTLGEHSEMGRVEVLSGLDAGERVVLYGPAPPPMPEPAKDLTGGEAK